MTTSATDPALDGKVAVVTGAASGIGCALSRRLVGSGARLVIADLDRAGLEATRQALSDAGADVLAVPTDVSLATDVAALRDAALARFGAVEILCNNAGVIGPVGDPLWELPFSEWERVMAVNLWGVLHGIQAFLPSMLAAGTEAHVLNTASMQGMTSGAFIPEYTVSKHAVVALSEALRAQLVARGARVHVSVLCPGGVSTQLTSKENQRLADRTDAWALAPDSSPTALPIGPRLLPASLVADAAVQAIIERRFYVFTHPDSMQRVRERVDGILASFGESGRL